MFLVELAAEHRQAHPVNAPISRGAEPATGLLAHQIGKRRRRLLGLDRLALELVIVRGAAASPRGVGGAQPQLTPILRPCHSLRWIHGSGPRANLNAKAGAPLAHGPRLVSAAEGGRPREIDPTTNKRQIVTDAEDWANLRIMWTSC